MARVVRAKAPVWHIVVHSYTTSRTAEQSKGGKTVGVDPTIITAGDARKLADKIRKKGGRDLKPVTENLVDVVWGKDRPVRPNKPVMVHPIEFSGKSIANKLTELRKELDKKKCSAFIVCEYSMGGTPESVTY
jgi:Xaa-Pro aminopeptidase